MTRKETNSISLSPIVLCMSGGGYRAASFHLGTMSYLQRLELLEEVTILSTVSGGTITGAAYALSLIRNLPYDEFYKNFYQFLKNTNLIEASLSKFGQDAKTYAGYLNFINAFAEVYDEILFQGARFGVLYENSEIHLKEIIFNSAEFRSGIGFCFHKSEDPHSIIGNSSIFMSKETAQHIRLADITAASSCFPGGFEPLAFPGDFQWPDDVVPQELVDKFKTPLPLMDGGTYDNQGIEIAVATAERTNMHPGLFIISDVDQPEEEMYQFPLKLDKRRSFISLGRANILSILLLFIAFFTTVILLGQLALSISTEGIHLFRYFFLYIIPTTLSIATFAFIIWARNIVKKQILSRIPQVGIDAWGVLKKLKIDQIAELVELRVTSLFRMASSVFMERIRGLIYHQIYSNDKYKDICMSNIIHDLSDENIGHSSAWLKPSPDLIETAKKATAKGTTLWFNEESELKDLIACGQFTICYNVLDHIIKRYGADPNQYHDEIRVLYNSAKSDWGQFNEDPFFLA